MQREREGGRRGAIVPVLMNILMCVGADAVLPSIILTCVSCDLP